MKFTWGEAIKLGAGLAVGSVLVSAVVAIPMALLAYSMLPDTATTQRLLAPGQLYKDEIIA